MKNNSRRFSGRVALAVLAAGMLVAVGAAPVPLESELGASAQAAPQKMIDVRDTVQRAFDVAPGGTLRIEADRGNIDIVTGEGRTLRVEVVRTVNTDDEQRARRVLHQHRVSFRQQGRTVRVAAAYDGSESIWNWRGRGDGLDVQMRVIMPRRFDVDLATGAGNLTIGDVRGDVRGETGAGNVRLGAIEGAVRLNSGAGNVNVERAGGPLVVETGAGNVRLRDVRSRATVNTGAGNITATITRQPAEASSLESGAGNVTVYLADRVGVAVEASTGVGSAHTDFPLAEDEGWVGTSLEGTIGRGGPLLTLSVGMGNVSLKKRR